MALLYPRTNSSIEQPSSFPVLSPEYLQQRRGPALPVVTFIVFGISTIVVSLRIYERGIKKRVFGLDDVLMTIAYILAAGQAFFTQFYFLAHGGDRHLMALTVKQLHQVQLGGWVHQMLFFWPCAIVKLSILAYDRRITKTLYLHRPSRLISISIAVLATLNVLFPVAITLYLTLNCRPISSWWTTFNDPAKCNPWPPFGMTSGVTNLVLDFAVLLLSFQIAFYFVAPKSQRILILFLLSLGISSCIAGALRVYAVDLATRNLQIRDVTWQIYKAYLYGNVEVNVGILCGCLPACKVLVQSWAEKYSSGKESLELHKTIDESSAGSRGE